MRVVTDALMLCMRLLFIFAEHRTTVTPCLRLDGTPQADRVVLDAVFMLLKLDAVVITARIQSCIVASDAV